MPKGKILIAEDDVNLAEILRTKLTALGYDILVAHNGEEASRLINEHRPDLSLLDIMMPKKSGLEVLEEMVKKADTKDLAFFMLSNLGQKKDIDTALGLGAKDYIVKANASLAEIVEKIDEFLKTNPPKERATSELRVAAPSAPPTAPTAPAQPAPAAAAPQPVPPSPQPPTPAPPTPPQPVLSGGFPMGNGGAGYPPPSAYPMPAFQPQPLSMQFPVQTLPNVPWPPNQVFYVVPVHNQFQPAPIQPFYCYLIPFQPPQNQPPMWPPGVY